MRIFLLLAALALAAPCLADDAYGEQRRLSVEATGLAEFRADVGAGSLTVIGDDDATRIEVEATLWIEDHPRDPDAVRRALDEHVELRLERDGDHALLVTRTRDPGLGYSLPHVDLEIRAPSRLNLDIVDRSGYIEASGFSGSVRVRDDSGSITLDRIGGAVALDDQSGSIVLTRVGGPVEIFDDSGSIELSRIGDDVAIRDDSGSIRVDKVNGDVYIHDGSGGIEVSDVSGILRVPESGSGDLRYDDVRGGVELDD